MKLRAQSRRAAKSTHSTADSHDLSGVDHLIDSYVRWREACVGVRLAYDRLLASRGRSGRPFFLAYSAALEHEEQAARVYEKCVERVGAGQLANRAG